MKSADKCKDEDVMGKAYAMHAVINSRKLL